VSFVLGCWALIGAIATRVNRTAIGVRISGLAREGRARR
jgi:hypothetical protein